MLDAIARWRRRIGAFVGGFEAGEASRRLRHFQPSRAHLNTLIAAAGADITARARWLVRNNGYAANAIESWAGNVVGNGIKPSSLITDSALKAAVQRLWLDWTDEADASGLTDFYGLQALVCRSTIEGGSMSVRLSAKIRASRTTGGMRSGSMTTLPRKPSRTAWPICENTWGRG